MGNVIPEAMQFVQSGPVQLTGRNAVIQIPSVIERIGAWFGSH